MSSIPFIQPGDLLRSTLPCTERLATVPSDLNKYIYRDDLLLAVTISGVRLYVVHISSGICGWTVVFNKEIVHNCECTC